MPPKFYPEWFSFVRGSDQGVIDSISAESHIGSQWHMKGQTRIALSYIRKAHPVVMSSIANTAQFRSSFIARVKNNAGYVVPGSFP